MGGCFDILFSSSQTSLQAASLWYRENIFLCLPAVTMILVAFQTDFAGCLLKIRKRCARHHFRFLHDGILQSHTGEGGDMGVREL